MKQHPKNCKHCGKSFSKKKISVYCSKSCSAKDTTPGRKFSAESRKKMGDVHRGSRHHAWISDRKLLAQKIAFKHKVRSSLRRLLTSGHIKNDTEEFGFSYKEFVNHIENQFLPGMSWDNYGRGRDSWSIDHIRPVNSFPLETEIKKINRLENLKPLWNIDNGSKTARWTGLRILVDMDEVLASWVQRILDWYNHDTKQRKRLDDITRWNVTDSLGEGSEIYIRNYMRYPNFYQDLEPMPGAIAGLRKLMNMGNDVTIVSSVPKCAGLAYEGKLQWLRSNTPFFSLNDFIACQRKDLVNGDILLDDGIHNLEAFRKTGRLAVAYERPWNMGWDGLRVKNWDEFLDLVEMIAKANVCITVEKS